MPPSGHQADDMVRDVRLGRAKGPCRGLKHPGPEAGSPVTGPPGAPPRATGCRHMSVMWPIPAYSRVSRIPATAEALSGKAREVAITAPSGPVILNLKFESSSLKSSNIPAMGLLPARPLSPALVLVAGMTARRWAAIRTVSRMQKTSILVMEDASRAPAPKVRRASVTCQ